MAHLPKLCESLRGVIRPVRRLLSHLPCQCDWRSLISSRCPLCSGAGNGGALCHRCHELVVGPMRNAALRCPCCCLALDAQDQCPDCTSKIPAFDRVIAAFDYCAPADLLIHRFKVSRHLADAVPLGYMLAARTQHVWSDIPRDLVVVSVPSSAQAILRRGFNPAGEVARVVARRLNRPYVPGVLRRVQGGHKQATLNREQRMISTLRLYEVAEDVRGVPVAVVDDVLTTGSTMHSLAWLLKRSGAVSVHGLVLGRTPRAMTVFF